MTFHPGEGHTGCTTDWISLLLYNHSQSSNVKVCLWRNVTFPKNGTMQYKRKTGKMLLTTNVAKGAFCDVAVVRVISFSIKISTSLCFPAPPKKQAGVKTTQRFK